jgi:predicted RNA-binding Zn ribbon-like protein
MSTLRVTISEDRCNTFKSGSLVTARDDTMQLRHARAAVEPRNLDFIGDHPAIDFINTLRTPFGEPFDAFQTDDDVKSWLVRAGLPVPSKNGRWPAGALVKKARQLREIALKAVQSRKAGKRPSLDALNIFLEHSASHPQLAVRPGLKIEITKIYSGATTEEFLAPVAEAIADLLANGDFELIRHCEGDKCVLWFYDRTKAHRRRWCSPTGCGNRAKVAAFRARAQEK